MPFWKRFAFYILILAFSPTLTAQEIEPRLKALNNYINFTNESIHGLLIIHRLLENFNQDINKYVDLEAYQINFYSNKDLPKNIFIDPEHWFYEITPSEWYKIAMAESSVLKSTERDLMNNSMEHLREICYKLNSIRFEIEEFISNNDLNEMENVEEVYLKLEKCVTWYDDFYDEQLVLSSLIEKSYNRYFNKANSDYSDIYGRMYYIHSVTESIFTLLRDKKIEGFDNYLKDLEKHANSFIGLKSFKSSSRNLRSSKFQRSKSKIEGKLQEMIDQASFFYNDGGVPKEYKLYGKFYYYHNSDLINKFNRYGNGFVFDMNQIIKMNSMSVVLFSEIPHYYQVIYPEKLEQDDHIAASDPDIENLPIKLRDRNVITNTRKIQVDSARLEINIFDHKIQDGDIVSLNFNGDWILEKQSIEKKPMTLKLKLNKEGKNYLLLHAENLGRRPPNTLGLSYYHKGVRKEIILESDLNASEMIEIEIDDH